MSSHEERCEGAERLRRIDEAFVQGDLEGLRTALGDPTLVPHGDLGVGLGTCLVMAIYRSPLAFVRTLLEMGADPNRPVDDGYPPLIAALACGRGRPDIPGRPDVDELLRLLLAAGADPNQRGVNDYTPLHMAVAERNALAVQRLLEAGADPTERTRIDDCETPGEMAVASGQTEIAAMLARRGGPQRTRLRSGLTLLVEVAGEGEPVRRQQRYRIRLRMWIKDAGPVRWTMPWGPVGGARLEDDGETLYTEVRVDRRSLVNGLFYGLDGMRVGGTRRLELVSQLGYGTRGVPGIVPPGATLVAEVTVIEEAHR